MACIEKNPLPGREVPADAEVELPAVEGGEGVGGIEKGAKACEVIGIIEADQRGALLPVVEKVLYARIDLPWAVRPGFGHLQGVEGERLRLRGARGADGLAVLVEVKDEGQGHGSGEAQGIGPVQARALPVVTCSEHPAPPGGKFHFFAFCDPRLVGTRFGNLLPVDPGVPRKWKTKIMREVEAQALAHRMPLRIGIAYLAGRIVIGDDLIGKARVVHIHIEHAAALSQPKNMVEGQRSIP